MSKSHIGGAKTEQVKKELLFQRYWRLRGEADELYQRRMKQIEPKIDEVMRKSIQKELDTLEKAIEDADLIEALRRKLVLEVLLAQ